MTLEAESTLSALEIRGLSVDRDQPFSPAVTSENLPELNWKRTEPLNGANLTEAVISAGNKGPLIVARYIRNNSGRESMDISLRIPAEDATCFLRHDANADPEGYKDWELIKTVSGVNPNGGNKVERVVFKEVSTDPTFILDDPLKAREWQKVLENTRILLSSLPNDYPEKEILSAAWQQVSVTDEATHTALLEQQGALKKQSEQEEQRRQMEILFPPTKKQTFIQRTLGRITTFLQGPNGYGSERSQPQDPGSFHDKQYYRR